MVFVGGCEQESFCGVGELEFYFYPAFGGGAGQGSFEFGVVVAVDGGTLVDVLWHFAGEEPAFAYGVDAEAYQFAFGIEIAEAVAVVEGGGACYVDEFSADEFYFASGFAYGFGGVGRAYDIVHMCDAGAVVCFAAVAAVEEVVGEAAVEAFGGLWGEVELNLSGGLSAEVGAAVDYLVEFVSVEAGYVFDV